MRRLRLLSAMLIAAALAQPVLAAAQGRTKNLIIVPKSGPLAGKQVYTNSHALLIGVNEYPRLPKDKWLQYALNDVRGMKETLVKSYGFPAENIITLTNNQATKTGIEAAMAKFSDPARVSPDDRVLIYFSGHGQTVKMPTGGDHGFLIPSDAQVDLATADNASPYLTTCVKMSTLWGTADAIPAKHVLFIADACYSGLMAKSKGATEKLSEALMARLAAKPARQVMTAGGAGEESYEDPKFGHGMFTYKLLEELKARASTPGDAFMAGDLFNTVKIAVGNLTNAKQNPQMNHFDTEGQFLFVSTESKPGTSPPATTPTPAPIAVSEKPSNKRRAVIMEINIAGISGNLPSRFDENLTNLLSIGLARMVNHERVSVLERKDLELINQQRNLTGSDDKIPGADIIISASVKDFKLNEIGVGGRNNPLGRLGGVLGGSRPRLPGGVTVARKEALVTLDIKAINAKTGETIGRFDSTGKEAVTDVGLENDMFRGFELSTKYFDENPVGKALKTALNKAVDQLAKEVEKAKI